MDREKKKKKKKQKRGAKREGSVDREGERVKKLKERLRAEVEETCD